MALQLGALRDALIDAGAKPEIAGKAAEELAAYDDQFEALARVISERFAEVDRRFAGQDTRLVLLEERMEAGFQRLTWMTATLILLVVGMISRLLFVH